MAILGANGSGKSTLIRAILGLVPLTAGTGRPVRRSRRRGRAYGGSGGGSGTCRSGSGAGSGVPATVAEVVASGRLARAGCCDPAVRGDRAAVAAAHRRGRPGRPGPRTGGDALRRPAAAHADRPGPGRRAGPAGARRADRRRRRRAARPRSPSALRTFVAGGGTVLLVAHELGPLRAAGRARAVVDPRRRHRPRRRRPRAGRPPRRPGSRPRASACPGRPARHVGPVVSERQRATIRLSAVPHAARASEDGMSLFAYDFMQRALLGVLITGPGRARARHLPGAAADGADRRRHRPHRAHRRRPRPAHQPVAGADRGRRRRPSARSRSS